MMASNQLPKISPESSDDLEAQITALEINHQSNENQSLDYTKRSQWLRAAVLGVNDGLVSIASLMVGVEAVKQDKKAVILSGIAGLVAGACSMAIGEFVSVYSQLDIEMAQIKRSGEDDEKKERRELPKPFQAAAASAVGFTVGAMVPLLVASLIKEYRVRLGVMVGAVSLALVVFGWLSAVLGGSPALRSMVRILVGGWLAMAITCGLTKPIGSTLL